MRVLRSIRPEREDPTFRTFARHFMALGLFNVGLFRLSDKVYGKTE